MAERYIGLLSGTSVDGVDVALVRFDERLTAVEHAITHPFPASLRDELLSFSAGRYHGDPIDQLGELDRALGDLFGEAVMALMAAAGVDAANVVAIGSHGQTVRHRPRRFTLQVGDPNRIATRAGIKVVGDFRRKDVALGGHGAPLVPAFHRHAFAKPGTARAIVNIGGIANITVLGGDGAVSGTDVGPGNALLDAWCERHLGAKFDRDGAWAATGRVDATLLSDLLADPFFAAAAPKSTGRELFALDWLERRAAVATLPTNDVQATLLELSASVIADHVASSGAAQAFICGGGAHNSALRGRIASLLPGTALDTTASLGVDVDYVEAAAFAWLARETLAGRAGSLPTATGADRPAVLGGLWVPE